MPPVAKYKKHFHNPVSLKINYDLGTRLTMSRPKTKTVFFSEFGTHNLTSKMRGRTLFCLLFLIYKFEAMKSETPDQLISRSPKPVLSTITVSIEPKRAVTKCSGEEQKITCQIIDYDGQLPKTMKNELASKGYGGYVEYLLMKRTTSRTAATGAAVGESVVADLRVNYPSELLQARDLMLSNLTIFDKGEYNCTVTWHGISGDNHWSSTSFPLNVYDCIDLEPQIIEASVGDMITMQCIDVEAPIKWFKDDEQLDAAEIGQGTTRSPAPAVQTRLKGVPGVRTISIRSIEDAGQYTCKGTFEDTQQIFTKNTEVRIKTAPTTPININPHRLSPTSVVLRWTQKPVPNRFITADPTFYTVFYKLIDSETFMSKTVLKNPEVMLTNLKANSVYFVRIQAENELGTSVSGSRIVVTPAANEIVQIDKRLLLLMTDHVKVLDQDLKSISNVLQDIAPEDDGSVSPVATPKPTAAGATAARRPGGGGGRRRRFYHIGRFNTSVTPTSEYGKFAV